MTVTCPNGHESATADYCDRCGAPIAPAPNATAVLPAVEEIDTSAAEPAVPCPVCGAYRSGDDRYCEECGHDFLAPAAPAAAAWEAVVIADRAQFDRVAPAGLEFPEACPERRFRLDRAALRIGRSRGRPGEAAPEIDLAGDPGDPGVSRLHAVLERRDDGGYTLRDLGSTNGTTVNDDPRRVGSDVAFPLSHGDRIRLGAWTTITLEVVGHQHT